LVLWGLGATFHLVVEKNSQFWRKISVTKVVEELVIRPLFPVKSASDFVTLVVLDILLDRSCCAVN
jgi:hypothetical protein